MYIIMKKNTPKKMLTSSKVELAVAGGVATALVSAGAYYFLASKNAKKHRAETVTWMKKAEQEVLSKAKKLKADTMNSKNYKAIVAEVSDKYTTLKNVDAADVNDFITTLSNAWKHIEKTVTVKGSAVKKALNTKVK